MTTWLMQWDASRDLTVKRMVEVVRQFSGKVCGVEFHPDYSRRAIVMVRFDDFDQAVKFGSYNHILNDNPIREESRG